jgi:glyoxylase-like metal-dependent hydrolase (beta-lactamase superfamily II)
MDQRIPIPETDIVAMDNIAPGLRGLRIQFVNVFLLRGNGRWVLVDAGIPGSGGRILRWAEQVTRGERPAYIVLTHGHFDHAGAAYDLAERWHIPVYAHPLEAPYLIGSRQYPPPTPGAGGGLMAVLSPLCPSGPFDLKDRLRLLGDSTSLPDQPEWTWLHTPGHTEGHISLFRESDRTLIVGDAFCTTKSESFLAVATQRPELHGPPAYYTSDWEAAHRSVQRLADLAPNIAAPGHGLPFAGPDFAAELGELSMRFEELAVP